MDIAEAIKFAEYAQIMAMDKPDVQEFYKLAEAALREQEALEAELKGERWRHSITKAKLEGTEMRGVVLCEECLFGKEPEEQTKGSGLIQCENSGILHKPDHYCGDGRLARNLHDVTRACEWISVSERLPEPFVSVLGYCPDEEPLPTVHECYVNGFGQWTSSVVYGIGTVTHWMEMPEPPEEQR